MSFSIFSDKDHQPTEQEVSQALGSIQPCWERLVQYISDNYQMPGELIFGGKNYGWVFRYRKSGKTLVCLYPQQEFFVSQIVLGKVHAEQALELNLGENVQQVLEDTPQLHDGRWLFIQVRSEEDVKDIEQLLQVKKPLRRRKVA